MIPFQTTPEQIAKIKEIMDDMYVAGVCYTDVDRLGQLAEVDQGVYELLEMWHKIHMEQEELLNELYKSLEDYSK